MSAAGIVHQSRHCRKSQNRSPRRRRHAQFIYRLLRKDKCPDDLARKIVQTLCLNCEFQGTAYSCSVNLETERENCSILRKAMSNTSTC